jgi:hypothetical protein
MFEWIEMLKHGMTVTYPQLREQLPGGSDFKDVRDKGVNSRIIDLTEVCIADTQMVTLMLWAYESNDYSTVLSFGGKLLLHHHLEKHSIVSE